MFGSVPPTLVAGPPTAVPPTVTPEPVVAETPDDEEEGGGMCSSTSGLPFEQSAANMLVLFAPVVMLGGAKYVRGRRRKDQII